eukprot:1540706-Rhodomonas_salina.1
MGRMRIRDDDDANVVAAAADDDDDDFVVDDDDDLVGRVVADQPVGPRQPARPHHGLVRQVGRQRWASRHQ